MDILEALRIEAMGRDPDDPLSKLFCDAYKEMERLRETLKEIKRLGGTTGYGRGALRRIAHKALEQ